MATGRPIGEIVIYMGECARLADRDKARALLDSMRCEMILDHGIDSLFDDCGETAKRINSNLGYLTGYMPQAYGNIALELLDVEHPVFGRNLDVTADEALAAGMRLAEQLRETKLAEERRAKIAAKRAAGLDVPDAGSAVSSASAKSLLEAIRAKRDGAVLAPVTDEDSAFGHIEVEEREVKLNALEKLAGKKTAAELAREAAIKKAEEDDALGLTTLYEDDDYEDDVKPVPVVVIEVDEAKEAANRERILQELEDAGAF